MAYLYSKEVKIVQEGDELTIFGLLTYDSKSDEFRFDNPLEFLHSSSRNDPL